jgi:hypothetical protein
MFAKTDPILEDQLVEIRSFEDPAWCKLARTELIVL